MSKHYSSVVRGAEGDERLSYIHTTVGAYGSANSTNKGERLLMLAITQGGQHWGHLSTNTY